MHALRVPRWRSQSFMAIRKLQYIPFQVFCNRGEKGRHFSLNLWPNPPTQLDLIAAPPMKTWLRRWAWVNGRAH